MVEFQHTMFDYQTVYLHITLCIIMICYSPMIIAYHSPTIYYHHLSSLWNGALIMSTLCHPTSLTWVTRVSIILHPTFPNDLSIVISQFGEGR